MPPQKLTFLANEVDGGTNDASRDSDPVSKCLAMGDTAAALKFQELKDREASRRSCLRRRSRERPAARSRNTQRRAQAELNRLRRRRRAVRAMALQTTRERGRTRSGGSALRAQRATSRAHAPLLAQGAEGQHRRPGGQAVASGGLAVSSRVSPRRLPSRSRSSGVASCS